MHQPVIGIAQNYGNRKHLVDAYAVIQDPLAPRLAVSVADALVDHPGAALTAQLGAHTAATAALTYSPDQACAAAHDRCADLQHPAKGSLPQTQPAIVTAVIDGRHPLLRIAWSGCCWAYAVTQAGSIHRLTDPSTPQGTPRIATRSVPRTGIQSLLLCSDGVSSTLCDTAIGLSLLYDGDPRQVAAHLAHKAGDRGPDNATAVVVQLLTPHTPKETS
ncbi:hypothetical protein [Streptomyces luteireticuli]|uniref:hypothetical protein n=1 Tax=Streptomyces luteireticuli TaxID=173858 RepID=UPI003557DB21